jgi:sulfate/thiosulfate-binding protein
MKTTTVAILSFVLLAGALAGCSKGSYASSTVPGAKPKSVTLLNASYDPTREFYQEFNAAFAEYWQQKTGQTVEVQQSHGGSGKQARAVIDGLEADVVTLALAYDINAIARKSQLLPQDWNKRLPHNSAPYHSTIVFLVRKGNPKQIKNWQDVVRPDVAVIPASPKTSGGARWVYLAAWGQALKQELGDLKKLQDPKHAAEVQAAQVKAREFVSQLYQRAPILDSAARAATNTFVQRGIGDVLIGWENEAFLAMNEFGKREYEVVVPKVSILAEPPVALVDKVAEKHGTREVAEAYLQHLYSPRGQQLASKHYYRPAVSESISADERNRFAAVELFTIDDAFGGWDQAQATHFDDGGIFDQIYQPGK